jgi:hypothetical protein
LDCFVEKTNKTKELSKCLSPFANEFDAFVSLSLYKVGVYKLEVFAGEMLRDYVEKEILTIFHYGFFMGKIITKNQIKLNFLFAIKFMCVLLGSEALA